MSTKHPAVDVVVALSSSHLASPLSPEQDRRSREGDRQTLQTLDSSGWLAGFTASPASFHFGLHLMWTWRYSMETGDYTYIIGVQPLGTPLSPADICPLYRSASIWTRPAFLSLHFQPAQHACAAVMWPNRRQLGKRAARNTYSTPSACGWPARSCP